MISEGRNQGTNEMKGQFIRLSIRFLRTLELIGGIATALLGVAIFLRIRGIDVAAGTSPEFRTYILLILMFIAPSVVISVGSYLQGRYEKHWAFVLVFIGGICNLYFLGLARFAFLYIGDRAGQFVVWTALLTSTMTLGAGFINTIWSLIFVSEEDSIRLSE